MKTYLKIIVWYVAAVSQAINNSSINTTTITTTTTKDFGKPFVYKEGDQKPRAIALAYDNAGYGNRDNISHHIIHSNNHVAKFEKQARSLEIDYTIVGQFDKRWLGFAHKVTSLIAYFRDNVGGSGGASYLTNNTFVVLFDARDCIFQQPWHVVVDTLTDLYHQQVTLSTSYIDPCSLLPFYIHYLIILLKYGVASNDNPFLPSLCISPLPLLTLSHCP